MNVLVTANCFLPGMGGTEVYSYDLALGFSRQPETRVRVLAPYSPDCKAWDADCPLEIIRYRSRLGRVLQFFKIVLSKKPDKIYVTHRAHFLSLAVLSRYLFKIPFWVTLHGTEYFGPDKSAGIVRKLRQAQRVVVTSNFVKAQAIACGVPQSITSLIPPSLDTERFHPGIDAGWLRQKFNLNGKKVLVTLCRLAPEKKVDHVIEALAKVKEHLPPFHYFILGKGQEEENLKKLVRDKGLDRQVTFVGMVPHHQLTSREGAYLSLADVFILTSREEPFGICYLEAGACGKPVIAYGSGGVLDVVVHEETGLLATPDDIDAAGSAIVRLLNDAQCAARLGANGRERIGSLFNHRAIHRRIWNLLQLNEI